MPSMYDMMYGGSSNPDVQQGYGPPRSMNNPMIRSGMQMMQGQNPFAPAFAATAATAGGQGKRRIRIGNKTYEEVDDYSPPPPANAPPQY
jgi:hypothetical protein